MEKVNRNKYFGIILSADAETEKEINQSLQGEGKTKTSEKIFIMAKNVMHRGALIPLVIYRSETRVLNPV